MKKLFLIIIFQLLITNYFYSQTDSVEVFIIGAYVTPEKPHTFHLSFFTSKNVKTKIKIDEKYITNVSNEFTEDHSAAIDFTNFNFKDKFVSYQIISTNEKGEKFESEVFEIVLPYEEFIETKEGTNPIFTILTGMLLYFLPSPNYVFYEGQKIFSLTKEIPVITFYSSGYNYPSGHISLEYSHFYKDNFNNILRFGYKHVIPIQYIEYISPGITAFTNFNGLNGIGLETSIGFFKVFDVFTVYSRYRYNLKPTNSKNHFHEISVGLYSNFFTIDF
ncbi:MAG: hypothetical protein CR986_09190 [Ignavibacteriae bacterium]|nr:MAG: hypothetical protein CR986_09190 [Ignavibacteriota bacterium]